MANAEEQAYRVELILGAVGAQICKFSIKLITIYQKQAQSHEQLCIKVEPINTASPVAPQTFIFFFNFG